MGVWDDSQDLDAVDTILPQLLTAAANGTTVDLSGYDAASIVFALGVFGGTGPSASIDIQDSPDGTTWTSVPAASLVGGALPTITPGVSDNQVCKRGYLGLQRYIRAAVTAISGTGPSLPICAVAVRSRPVKLPTAATE